MAEALSLKHSLYFIKGVVSFMDRLINLFQSPIRASAMRSGGTWVEFHALSLAVGLASILTDE